MQQRPRGALQGKPSQIPSQICLRTFIIPVKSHFCNNTLSAGHFQTQLLQLLVILGDPYYGVITQSESKGITLEPPYFEKLEEHLSKYQRFFVRYTTEDFIQATLCGKDPAMRCDEYKRGIPISSHQYAASHNTPYQYTTNTLYDNTQPTT